LTPALFSTDTVIDEVGRLPFVTGEETFTAEVDNFRRAVGDPPPLLPGNNVEPPGAPEVESPPPPPQAASAKRIQQMSTYLSELRATTIILVPSNIPTHLPLAAALADYVEGFRCGE
jgi:hypothetical protein